LASEAYPSCGEDEDELNAVSFIICRRQEEKQ